MLDTCAAFNAGCAQDVELGTLEKVSSNESNSLQFTPVCVACAYLEDL